MAGTLAATEIGGGSSLGVVQNGMSGYGISAAWYIITMGLAFVILTFMAPKFRAATVKTVPEYFRRRYGKSAGLITATMSSSDSDLLGAGSIVVIYAENISKGMLFGMNVRQPIIPGLIVGLVFFVIFSLIFPPRRRPPSWHTKRADLPNKNAAPKGAAFFRIRKADAGCVPCRNMVY